MRRLLQVALALFLITAFCSRSFIAGADKEEKQNRAFAVEASDDQKTDVRYHLKALEVYVKELEIAEEADRRTNPKYAEEVVYLETRRRLMAATVEDFEMGRASTDDYRRCSEELAESELQSIIRHEERLKAAKAHVARMTELATTVKRGARWAQSANAKCWKGRPRRKRLSDCCATYSDLTRTRLPR